MVPSCAALLTAMLVLTSCSGKKKRSLDHVPEDVRPVAEAIINDSPEEFAHVVSYPVTRPYPLRDVKDSAQMVSYYPTLVDGNMKKSVEEAPDSAWQQAGWRGWTLGNGSFFWIDAGKIYDITYVSDREHMMLDSLQKEEISTLEPSLQAGWMPVMCVNDSISGIIFRIDSQDDTNPPIYRLAGYGPDSDLSGEPEIVLYGSLELEGSMGNRFYTFSDDEGTTAIYAPDLSEDDGNPQIEIDKEGMSRKFGVRPDYWLDHMKRPRKNKHNSKGSLKQEFMLRLDSLTVKNDSVAPDTTSYANPQNEAGKH